MAVQCLYLETLLLGTNPVRFQATGAKGTGVFLQSPLADGSCPAPPYPSFQFFAGYLDTTSPLGVPGTMSAIPIQSLLLVIALFFAAFLGFKTGFRP